MWAFCNDVNGSNNYTGKYVKLAANIDLTGKAWTPIGNTTSSTGTVFSGIFDGGNFTISNLSGDNGLFGYINNGTVKNLTINANIIAIKGGNRAGGIIGSIGAEGGMGTPALKATFVDCNNSGTITITPSDANIIVKDSDGKVVVAEKDGTYKLINGNYTYVISKEGYENKVGEFTVKDEDQTITVALSKKPETSPNTGDNSMAPFAVVGLALAAMAAVVATRRRTN